MRECNPGGVTEARSPLFGGAGDAGLGAASLSRRFRRHASSLERAGRSPLYIALMRAAATDIDHSGRVADLFARVPNPPGSVPALRLLAALHHLVLSGRAPALAVFYPSAGGERPPDGVWPVALETLDEHAGWVGNRLARPVQTNEPGRATVLYAGLLWLTARHALPIRLLEIGASAELNLLVDRWCYVAGGTELGASTSPLRFTESWSPAPDIDLRGASERLLIAERSGCDPAPLNPASPEDRLTALAYIWPDEPERLERTRLALELAAADPPPVVALPAEEWLPEALSAGEEGQLTVIWQSVVRQYVEPAVWESIERSYSEAAGSSAAGPVVWLRMEPAEDHLQRLRAHRHGHARAPAASARPLRRLRPARDLGELGGSCSCVPLWDVSSGTPRPQIERPALQGDLAAPVLQRSQATRRNPASRYRWIAARSSGSVTSSTCS